MKPDLSLARLPLGRTVITLSVVSFFTDLSSEMIYPLLPLFLAGLPGGSPALVGLIEGAAESTAALLKLASGWWSDRVRRRKPLVVAGYAMASLLRPLIGFATAPLHVLLIRLGDRVGKGIRSSPRDALIADAVDPSQRGRAFGVHRAADHAGAVIGPLLAFALLQGAGVSLRQLFLYAAIPGAIAVVVLVFGVRERAMSRAEVPAPASAQVTAPLAGARRFPPRFWAVLGAVLLFTLGNSTDAFLLLRARELGVPIALIPVLWAALHVVKAAASTPGGALSDRIGRTPGIIAGWSLYAVVYLLFGRATEPWQAWALFGVYGLYFGLVEGAEKALVADLAPPERRGAAFGWYNLAVGIAALPASLLFGLVWTRAGATAAFTTGAGLALAASVALVLAAPRRPGPTSAVAA